MSDLDSRPREENAEDTAPLIQNDQADPEESTGISNKLFIWSLTLSAGVSGLLFGYDTGVISSTLVSMGSDLSGRPLTVLDKSLITACTSLFALIVSPLAGSLADRIGRKRVILFADVLFILGALWQAFSSRVWSMIIGRSIVGLAIGGASLIVPLYISELAPSDMRGRLVTVSIMFVTGGQVVAYLIGWALSSQPAGWRWMVGVGAIPAVVQIVALSPMPESPRWLVKMDRQDLAKSILSKVYKGTDDEDNGAVERLLRAIEQEHLSEAATKPSGRTWILKHLGSYDELASLIRVGPHRRALAIACLLQGLQQLCGFNSIMYFAGTLLEEVGFSSPTLTALSIAITNFVFTLVAYVLVDRVGRRRILLYSIPFMILALLSCAEGFVQLTSAVPSRGTMTVLGSLIVYVAAYALGMGNVPWQQSELFPLSVRSMGSAIATAVNWSSNFVVGLTFLPMMQYLDPPITFICYAVICMVGWIIIWVIYPETMGLGLEEINALLTDGWGVKESLQRRKRPPD